MGLAEMVLEGREQPYKSRDPVEVVLEIEERAAADVQLWKRKYEAACKLLKDEQRRLAEAHARDLKLREHNLISLADELAKARLNASALEREVERLRNTMK